MNPSNIGQIAIQVKNLDRAVAFYRDVLGLQFLFQAPPGLAFFQCGEVRIMLETNEVGASTLYYKVSDLEGTYESLKMAEVDFIDEPHKIADMPDHELWMFFLHDSEGNTVSVMAEKPLSA